MMCQFLSDQLAGSEIDQTEICFVRFLFALAVMKGQTALALLKCMVVDDKLQ